MEIYKVGGAVRDKLLGLPVKDCDWVVVGGTPEDMLSRNFQQVGRDFPVFIHPETHEEYALARTERKTGPGYKGFVVNAAPEVTLEDDLVRRDITINAIAQDKDGTIIDPFNGRQDLIDGVLRHVSQAFTEDPVRILRVARFSARFGFSVADETLILMKTMVESNEVSALVPERVWAETEKALLAPEPRRFFERLRDCHALEILFPEIDRLFGVPLPEQCYPKVDAGLHTLTVLERASSLSADPMIRLASLIHDLGKGATSTDAPPNHTGPEEHSVELINNLCQRLRIPKDYRELAVITARYHNHCHRAGELPPTTLVEILEAVDAFRRPQRFKQFLLVCEADASGRKGLEGKPYTQANLMRAALKKSTAIDTDSLAASGLKGKAMAEAVRQERISALKG